MNKFAQRVKELRIEKNWTQKDLADKLGYNTSAVSEWENRGKEPNYDTLIKISKIFNVSLGYLLGEDYD